MLEIVKLLPSQKQTQQSQRGLGKDLVSNGTLLHLWINILKNSLTRIHTPGEIEWLLIWGYHLWRDDWVVGTVGGTNWNGSGRERQYKLTQGLRIGTNERRLGTLKINLLVRMMFSSGGRGSEGDVSSIYEGRSWLPGRVGCSLPGRQFTQRLRATTKAQLLLEPILLHLQHAFSLAFSP